MDGFPTGYIENLLISKGYLASPFVQTLEEGASPQSHQLLRMNPMDSSDGLDNSTLVISYVINTNPNTDDGGGYGSTHQSGIAKKHAHGNKKLSGWPYPSNAPTPRNADKLTF